MPGMVVVTDPGQRTVIEADPVRVSLALGLRQRLVRQPEHGLRGIAMNKGCQADGGHRDHVRGAGRMQAGQGGVEVLRQLQGLLAHQPWRQHGEFAASDPRDQILRFRVSGALAGQLLADRLKQLIGALPAQPLVQTRQVLNPQQQQITGTGLFGIAHPCVQLHLKITSIGQPGKAILIGLDSQFFTAFGLFLKQRLELLDHLVHGQYHSTQFRRAR